jgi:hypothetical protein
VALRYIFRVPISQTRACPVPAIPLIRAPRAGLLLCTTILMFSGAALPAGAFGSSGVQQNQGEQPAPPNAPAASSATRTAVSGIVKNAATGEPLPRALVRIEGDAFSGALTDGEGRFELTSIPVGPQIFQVVKPGFSDQAMAGIPVSPALVVAPANSEHNVWVAVDMPDLVFTLSPMNAIHGQISLSTGDPAEQVYVMLLRRSVQDGRALWQTATSIRTNSDGVFRFAGLADGTYAIYTEPAMDNDLPASLVEPGSDRVVTRSGYASVFFPDSRDLAGAQKIQLNGGQVAQANILLTQEVFHPVRAALTLPGAGSASAERPQLNVTVTIQDGQGNQLPYIGQYEAATQSIQAFLPDGSYSLVVTVVRGQMPVQFGPARTPKPNPPQGPLMGQADFSVAGQAVTGIRIPLAAQRSNLVQLSLLHTGPQQGSNSTGNSTNQGSPIVILLSQAGPGVTDGMVSSYAEGYTTGPIETTYMGPGSYWVHTAIPQKSLCESSFTAGGASLAREPLILSLTGVSAPLTLSLRDDCATLKLSLPTSADNLDTGEEPYFTVYVVPDFDSTADVTPITLRPSSGGAVTIDGLTPGDYHVYTFAARVELEYRNREALASLSNPGQTVTLTPASTTSLVVEVPGH